MKKSIIAFAVIAAFAGSACTRIESGTVGLRQNMSKQVEQGELQPGSWNQVIFGDVLEFQVRAIQVAWNNLTPQTADNSTLKDFDVALIYEINQTAVSELWIKQSRSFHAIAHGDQILMFNYMTQVLNSAAAKAVRKYKALEVADNRQNIETDIHNLVMQMLKDDHLDTALSVTQVRVSNATPADDIVASANAAVRAQNDLKTKQVEVQIAQQEALKQQAMNSIGQQSLEVMRVQAQMEIAKAVREGKVNTLILPMDFRGMVNVGTH